MPIVLDAQRIARSLARIAHEILERNHRVDQLALIGIRRRGVPLAKRLARAIHEINQSEIPTGALDITLYRDDLMRTAIAAQPLIRRTEIPFSIDDKRILLVDDVLYTGRTIRAALDALIEFGRPKAIQLAVLVDRGHRELPIKADYVGKNLPTSLTQSVQVRLTEIDGRDEVEGLESRRRTSSASAISPATRFTWCSTPPRRCARSASGRSRKCPRCAARRS